MYFNERFREISSPAYRKSTVSKVSKGQRFVTSTENIETATLNIWVLNVWINQAYYGNIENFINLATDHVHILLYGVKFNSEIDIIQFIFTRCVVYPFKQKMSLQKKKMKNK